MSKRQSVVIVTGTTAILFLLLAGFPSRKPDPWYKSRKISFWVDGIRLPNSDTDRFVNTVIDIGLAAVPCLVKEFRNQSSALRRSALYGRFRLALPITFQRRLSPPIVGCGTMPAIAYTLGSIGPPARSAIPVLIQGANDRSKDVRSYSIWALGQIGASEAREVVSSHLHDGEVSVREDARLALLQLEYMDRGKTGNRELPIRIR